MQEDIVILEEPVATEGITDVSDPMAGALLAITKVKSIAIPKPKPPEAKIEGVLHNGNAVYAVKGNLFQWTGSRSNTLGYTDYAYIDYAENKIKAASMRHGTTPVFACTQNDLDIFVELLQRVTITVAPGKTLLFFPSLKGGHGNAQHDDIVTLCYDGVTLRYGGYQSGGFSMRLPGPIGQTPEDIFNVIARFITSTVAGTRKDLVRAEQNLAGLAQRRAEEVYLHLSSFTPPAGSEDIHTFAMEAIEAAYLDDSRTRREYVRNLEEAATKIKNARSQMPSGRKGVPIRNGYLQSPVLKEMLENFTIVKNGQHIELNFAFRKDLVVEGISYGRPLIFIRLVPDRMNGRHNSHISLVTAKSQDLKAFLHPHLNGEASWCLGTYVTPLSNAIVGGNIPMAVSLLWQYLSTYNPASPLVNLDSCRQQMAAVRARDIVVRRI